MINQYQYPKIIFTNRLVLIPFTKKICVDILESNFNRITTMGLRGGLAWPDADLLETLPRIINNLNKVEEPSGFESWMIIKKDSNEIIGDIGFKGYNSSNNSCDLGYGIIAAERRKGFAEEACNAIINWTFEVQNVDFISASTLSSNQGSILLLKKLKFDLIHQTDGYIFWKLNRI